MQHHPLPEYPRPALRRDSYENLNGLWQYAITSSAGLPAKWDGDILVPYSPETKASGVGRTLRPGIVLDEENRRVLVNGQPLELTETEFSILHCLAENRGRVVPVRTIYETVWHETYMPASNNTVMVHIVNLRKKLEEDPANPRLIRTVWGKGYQID